ncbi:response regulator [Parabacteroides sp. 52]|uniref:ATP-binding response regulator n=1 Tax=Parabacteroides sp. 52 TaxID=2302940 RepID=UPI0013D707CC|nr:ATP-binding protein [Parabacteroides sp. 52]NDV54208.1 response regulator [Parabacteroides sp. 52]
MKNQLGRIAPKVVLGYIILIVIAVGSLSYIYNVIDKIAAEEDVNSIPRKKIYLVTETQALLLESETMGQLVDMEEDDYSYFNATLDLAHQNMDSLRLLITDSLLLLKIDTIDMLIERKRANTNDLLEIWKQANADLYAKNIAKAMASKAPSVEEKEIQERVELKKDTVIVQGRKRSFLKRLAEVFVPTDKDSSIIVSANEQTVKDTMVNAYNPNEAIHKTLKNIQNNVAGERKRLRELLVDRSSTLRYDNSLISSQINQILRDMEEEELTNSLNRLQSRQDILEQTSYLISGIALISLIVAIFFLVLIARDLFKSNFYRKQLEKEKKYTEDLLHSRERLMLTISHDIRAPLSSIIGYIELLQRSYPDEQQRLYLKNMSGSSSHILSLVNDLLDFQRLESGQMEIHEVPFKVPDLFHEIYDSFQPQASKKGLEFVLDIKEESDFVYKGDSVRIRQVIGNLLSNAVKFTQQGKVEISVDCSQLALNNEELVDAEGNILPVTSNLIVTVYDSGAGIPEEEQKKIFAEFTRLPGAEKTEGFGLGLSITNKLVALMGGELSLQSTAGQGSAFTVSLPLPFSDNQSLPDPVKEDTIVDNTLFVNRSVRCLIVDDDLLQLALMEEVLKQNHIKVTSCINPYAVLDILKESVFDVVITDIQMPGMDGYDLVKQIRTSGIPGLDELPVIALSATVGKDTQRYLDAGFSSSLDKPFTAEQLVNLLNKLLPVDLDVKTEPDFLSLTAFAGEDKEASAHILRTFSTETNKSLTLLREALAESDRDKSARVSHKLIPLFTMLGADILVQQLKILEKNNVELSDAGWQHLLTDVIDQASSIVDQATLALE